MAKAIVKINAFLDKKQTDEVYKSIYNQLKAGLDIIIVPAYCDVYILDGADVEMQKDEKKECTSCKHYMIRPFDTPPCGWCNDHDKWEAKDNG